MKNIFLLPTDQLTSVLYGKDDKYKLANSIMSMDWFISSAGYKPKHIYITSDEEIEEGDWGVDDENVLTKFCTHFAIHSQTYFNYQKVVLTTDPKLIAEGVQSIDDEFLEWFVKNSSCEFVVIDWSPLSKNLYGWKIIIPKEEPKQEFLLFDKERANTITSEGQKTVRELQNTIQQETLEEAAENYSKGWGENDDEKSFISGGKWMVKRMFSKEEVRKIAEWSFHFYKTNEFDDSELEEEWYKLLDERLNKK